MNPKTMMLLQGSIAVIGIFSLLAGRTGFGVFCLLAAMAPSFYARMLAGRPPRTKPRHHHPTDSS